MANWIQRFLTAIDTHKAELDAHTKDVGEVLRTGEYQSFGRWQSGTGDTLALNTLYASPIVIARKMTFDRIAVDVTALAAGASARLGIYADGTNLYPGALVLDAGTVSVASTGIKAATINQQLDKGLYWLAFVSDGSPDIKRAAPYAYQPLGVVNTDFAFTYTGWSVAHGYAALPDPFTAGGTVWNTVTRWSVGIYLRLSSLD